MGAQRQRKASFGLDNVERLLLREYGTGALEPAEGRSLELWHHGRHGLGIFEVAAAYER